MAAKTVILPDVGEVKIYKRRGSTNIRLSVGPTGQIRITMPYWAPYSAGISFAKTKLDWLKSQKVQDELIDHGAQIGRRHSLIFIPKDITNPRSSTKGEIITVFYPHNLEIESDQVQATAKRAGLRALKSEAEDYLPNRARELADEHGFSVKSIEIKKLSGRWGSCNSRNEIVLNCYLMQLPWDLIDYVIFHELNHTVHMSHSKEFWESLALFVPNLASIRKQMRTYRPILNSVINTTDM